MVTMIPEPGSAETQSLRAALDSAMADGGLEPSFVAVAADGDDWRCGAITRCRCERNRAVLAASSDRDLADGVAFAFGGAVPLPASAATMADALRAAAGFPVGTPLADAAVVDGVMAWPGDARAVSFSNRELWRCELGDRRLEQVLGRLAEILDAQPLILPGPILLAATDDKRLDASWREIVTSEPIAAGLELESAVLHSEDRAEGLLGAVWRAVARADRVVSARSAKLRPVYELPSGSRVGWWSPAPGSEPTGGEWIAAPVVTGSRRCEWMVRHPDGGEHRVLDVAVCEDVTAGPVARVAGWAADRPIAGSPSGLLLTRLAAAAARVGVPLWVPNVEAAGLRFLMRLGVTLWVDGPAVPED